MTRMQEAVPAVAEDATAQSIVHALLDHDCIPQQDHLHDPQCCCGDATCKFLTETAAAFDRLDESLRTAGRLGQALLVRHETYVAEAEAERKHMRDEFDRLSQDKAALQTQNTAVIDENRQLLEQLESANTVVTDSDAQVKSLTATLHTAQDEIHRLNSLARRTQALERELEQFELEQSKLQSSLAAKTEQERVATLRWQSSERTLSALEDRVEAIESEARAEREHHIEVLGRIERQRALEKELDTAAGRLKGAAAVRTSQGSGNGVVSHFVKDILQDNANLQMSVVELREMLTNANEEVERLREQLLEHIPSAQELTLPEPAAIQPLSQEMHGKTDALRNNASAQEVHVHHHYHAPQKPEASRRNSQQIRRPKKRRQGINFGHFVPASGHRTPNMSISTSNTTSHPASKLSTPYASPPNNVANHRWSMQSAAALSSVPSSPRSYNASLFDRSYHDVDPDSSRPTTPGTEAGESPFLQATHRKRLSESFFQPLDETLYEDTDSFEDDSKTPTKATMPRDAHQTPRAESPSPGMASDDDEEDPEHSLVDFNQPVPHPRPRPRPRPRSGRTMPLRTAFTEGHVQAESLQRPTNLHRAASHESLLSVSGMDIHTLKSRPSQMLTGQNTRSFSSEATISPTIVTAARPTLHSKTSQALLADVAADQNADNATYSATQLSKRVSGWMFGRWGGTAQQAPSPLNPVREQDAGADPMAAVAAARTPENTTSYTDNTINHDNSIDDDDVLEGADFADSGRGGAEAESERVVDDVVDDNAARPAGGSEAEDEDEDWRFGVYNPFG